MKAVRITIWAPDCTPLMTMAAYGESFKVPVEEIGDNDGVLTITDVFDTQPDLSMPELTTVAMRRASKVADDEHNMAILYYWTLQHFRIMRPRGTIATIDPSPLSVEQIRTVFAQLGKAPGYRDFTFATKSQDGTPVRYP